ncbi:MAG: transglycosylase family protein [Acidimicrobiales bacterium]
MRRVMFALALFATTAVTLPSPSASAATPTKPVARAVVHPRPRVSAVVHALVVDAAAIRVSVGELRAKWQQVAICEVDGNWSMTGPVYSGIGFLNSTWYQYGGRRFAPVAGEATVDQQILIGMRVTHGWVPDQYGCSPSGW